MEIWMINIAVILAGGIGTYAVLKNRVGRLEDDLSHHDKHDEVVRTEFERKNNAQFKKIDDCLKRITILERDTQSLLTMGSAEEKFATKKELELHLRNFEIKQENMDKKLDKMEKGLEKIIEMLTKGGFCGK